MGPNRLSALYAERPPTPPKDLSTSDPLSLTKSTQSSSPLDTPTTPCVSTPDYFSSRLPSLVSKKRKRVNFDLAPVSSTLPSSSPALTDAHSRTTPSRHSPPSKHSRQARNPGKSILKVRQQHGLLSDITLNSDDFNINLDFSSPLSWKSDKIKMLDESCKQLESMDKSVCLDAYQNITSAMKKYDDLPKLDEFVRRIPAFMEYVLRDLKNRNRVDHRDGQLTLEALKLATICVWRDPPSLSDNAKSTLLQWCVNTLEDPKAAKNITNHTLSLLSFQNFTKVLSPVRVQKLLRALEKIDSRISGTQVRILRLDIYKSFAAQSSQAMAHSASLWMGPFVESLVSDRLDISTKATGIGRDLAISLGRFPEVCKELERLLNLPIPVPERNESEPVDLTKAASVESTLYADVLVTKLKRAARDKTRSELVPQIWSIFVLFLQRRRSVITSSPHKKRLLELLQYCLNKVPSPTKTRAVIAWQDLIFTLRDDMHKSVEDMELVGTLFRKIFQRFDGDKALASVETTYCTFLYYALWPKASLETITSVWNTKVAKHMKRNEPKSQVRPEFALQVLAALLGAEPQVVWDEKRTLQKAPILPQDLPRVDAKWVEINLPSVFDVLDSHIAVAAAEESDLVYRTWRALNDSLKELRNHEILPSAATMSALAQLLTNIIKTACRMTAGSTEHQSPATLTHVCRLSKITLTAFGPRPCNKKGLWVDEDNVVRSTEPPKSNDSHEEKSSALDIILSMTMSDCMLAGDVPESFQTLTGLLVDRRLESTVSRGKRLQTLAELSQEALCDEKHTDEQGQNRTACLKAALWYQICNKLIDTLPDSSSQQSSPDSQTLGADFQQAVTILVNGFGHDTIEETQWARAFELLLTQARAVLPESTRLAVIEGILDPLAQGINQKLLPRQSGVVRKQTAGLSLVSRILTNVEWHESGDTYQQAQKSLWGSTQAISKKDLHGLYDNIVQLFATALSWDGRRHKPTCLAPAVISMITRCPENFFWQMLEKVHVSIGNWISGSDNKAKPSACFLALSDKIRAAWSFRPSKYMHLLDTILHAGFDASRDSEVTSAYVMLWENNIWKDNNVTCSPSLILELRRVLQVKEPELNRWLAEYGKEVLPMALPRAPDFVRPATASRLTSTPGQADQSQSARSPSVLPESPAANANPNRSQPSTLNVNRDEALPAQNNTFELELPSSPPEVPADPDLPAVRHAEGFEFHNNAIKGRAVGALPMSDELQRLDSSPTPAPRGRPGSASATCGLYDVPASPTRLSLSLTGMRSDPVQVSAQHAASSKKRKQPKNTASTSREVSSKHFPVIVHDEDGPQMNREELSPGLGQTAPTRTPVAPVAKEATAVIDVEVPQVIDLDAIPESQIPSKSTKRKQNPSVDGITDQPEQKRPRGRPRNNPGPAFKSQDSVIEQPKPRRGRSRKNSEAPTSSQDNLSQQNTQSSRGRGISKVDANIRALATGSRANGPTTINIDDDDDVEDCITVLSESKSRNQRQSRTTGNYRTLIGIAIPPLAVVDVQTRPRSHARRRSSRIGSINVEPHPVERRSVSTEPLAEKTSVDSVFNDDGSKSSARLRRRSRRISSSNDSDPDLAEVNLPTKTRKRQHKEICLENSHVDETQQIETTQTSVSSPSSQLINEFEASTPPPKKRKIARPRDNHVEPELSGSPLSKTAQNILANLRGVLGSVRNMVLGRSDARQITRTLNDISNAVLEAEEKGEDVDA